MISHMGFLHWTCNYLICVNLLAILQQIIKGFPSNGKPLLYFFWGYREIIVPPNLKTFTRFQKWSYIYEFSGQVSGKHKVLSVVGPFQNRYLVRSSPPFDEKPCYHLNSVTVKDSVGNVIEGLFSIGRYNSNALNRKHRGTCYVSYLPLKNYKFFLDERSQKLCVIGT